ncbi:RidA family protein [Geothrix sp. 21YS21S-4]|uniref:RidA family protein n=1 Tax=Geothrix sp. 21YS21S-4 TaxID=3068889 RepID=UPI0027B914FE|nr:RidA family protein [Geothrix sp. 21YS21S-4]
MTSTQQPLKPTDVITLDQGGSRKQFISARREGSDELAIFDAFKPGSSTVVAQMAFGGLGFHDAACARMGGVEWPMFWLQGDVCPGVHVAGVQSFAMEGRPVRRVMLSNRVVGSFWSDEDADYCLLAGLLPADPTADRSAQTLSSFEQMEAGLKEVGMDFSHVVRTWFYLDELLDWYDEFNVARTAFFEARGVFDRLIPASTGIGASNPAGAAVASGALAIRPRHDRVHIQEVESPLQNPATEYRSSFSRAVEMAFPDRRVLTISGTASIAPDGKTVHQDDVVKQIQLTLDVIEGILKSRGMDWQNTTRAVAYFHDIAELPTFDAICRERGIPPLPVAPAHATVCRADLLFEMELDAVLAVPASGKA